MPVKNQEPRSIQSYRKINTVTSLNEISKVSEIMRLRKVKIRITAVGLLCSAFGVQICSSESEFIAAAIFNTDLVTEIDGKMGKLFWMVTFRCTARHFLHISSLALLLTLTMIFPQP